MFEGLFSPRGVAVVGASLNPTKLGYGVARNLVVSGYPGAIHFVNPRGGRLFDRPLHHDLASVPDPVDLAVIMIPAPAVPEVLTDCGKRGIHFAIVGAGGFRETGEDGRMLEERALAAARNAGVRVLGPNCIGYLDTHLPIDTSFLPLPGPIQGEIAFLSHSGAICEAVIDWARGQGFGLSRLVSLGNQMDLNEGELLPPTADDPNTRVVAMYLEGIGEGRNFIEQARKVTGRIPVVAIKVGQSKAGRAAVASHTGAMAGSDDAFDAAFRKAGVIRARHSEEMFDWARALAWCPLPDGPEMAVLTNAGGPGAIAADALAANGLRLARLAPTSVEALAGLLPEAASLKNPIDMLAGAGPREYADCLRVLLEDENVDGVIVILPPPPVTTAAEVAGALIPLIQSVQKPVVVALMGEELIAHAARLFRGARIPDYRFPERAASALRVLHQRALQLEQVQSDPVEFDDVRVEQARAAFDGAGVDKHGFLLPSVSAEVAACFGIPVPDQRRATSEDEACEAALAIGFPVVMKVEATELVHKSDLGALALNLQSQEAVRAAYRGLVERVAGAAPSLSMDGVILQPYLAEGQEVILGFVRDEQFGPLVMFGAGGVEVEALQDVAFELTPLAPSEAERLIEGTWAGRRLRGFRGLTAVDREAVVETILRMSQLAETLEVVDELEINPLRVMPGDGGAWALDVRVRIGGG
ncbi:MAG: acetate--CoA ligase family protein [Anaerolineales bacterium]|nr:acetate--CoA ligase family protein [Anaerolineales bacterium]